MGKKIPHCSVFSVHNFGQKREGGFKKCKHYADVICVSSLVPLDEEERGGQRGEDEDHGEQDDERRGERLGRRLQGVQQSHFGSRFAFQDCHGTNSLQLFIVEFYTCIVLELLLLPSNSQTGTNLPSFKGNKWRH